MLRHRKIGVLVALFLSIWTAVAAAAPYAYITNSGTGTVSVIDVATQNVVATVTGGSLPLGVALTPDGAKAYITDQGNGSLLVVDTATKGLVKTLAINSLPFGVAVSPDGSKAYVTRFLSTSVSNPSLYIIDTTTDEIISKVWAGMTPMGAAVHPDGTKVYVAVSNGLSVVNGSTMTVRAAGSRPFGVAVNSVLKRVYVSNRDSASVSVFDATTDTLITNIPVGQSNPQGIAVSPNGKWVYVANHFSNTVTMINAETNAVVEHYAVGTKPYGLQVTPDGRHVYVANWESNTVSVLDAATGALVKEIGLPPNSKPAAFGIFMVGLQALTVDIDIMPGGNPNTISRKSKGTLPVAILSSESFDATTVNPLTVKLAGASVAMRGNGKPMASFEDVNEDGRLDLVVHVRREELQLSAGDTVAVFEGRTEDGVAITGSDSVKVVP